MLDQSKKGGIGELMKRGRLFSFAVTAGAAAMLGIFALQGVPEAASQRYAGPTIAVGGKVTLSPPTERTPEAIAADVGFAPSGSPPLAALEVLPTMPIGEYRTLKAAADTGEHLSRLSGAKIAAPANLRRAFGGAKEGVVGKNIYPSDDDMDVSGRQIAQVTNASLWVFNKSGGILAQHSLNSLFGTRHFLTDPQILFDSAWHRWVISVDDVSAILASPPTSFNYLWVAVSKTSSATGSWYIYKIGFHGGDFTAPNFLDYPHLGMDQDALLFTGSIFDSTNGAYLDTTVFAIAKAVAYNNRSKFSFPAFTTGPVGTLMPPVLLGRPWYDANGVDYFAVAAAGTGVSLYTMTDAGRSQENFSGPVLIPSTNFSMPPNAVEPGCGSDVIDTLDGRFQNACYQTPANSTFPDGLLYCVHTVGMTVGTTNYSEPQWYAFDPSTNLVAYSGYFYYDDTSYDFNPSLAADAAGDIFVTETATDPFTGAKPMVLFGGALADGSVVLNSAPVGKSRVCLKNPVSSGASLQRWGDYSAARFDPKTSASGTPGEIKGWITNQKVGGNHEWTTRIAKIKE